MGGGRAGRLPSWTRTQIHPLPRAAGGWALTSWLTWSQTLQAVLTRPAEEGTEAQPESPGEIATGPGGGGWWGGCSLPACGKETPEAPVQLECMPGGTGSGTGTAVGMWLLRPRGPSRRHPRPLSPQAPVWFGFCLSAGTLRFPTRLPLPEGTSWFSPRPSPSPSPSPTAHQEGLKGTLCGFRRPCRGSPTGDLQEDGMAWKSPGDPSL